MARCPECAGKMTFNSFLKSMVCNSCGLTLNRDELDKYWAKIRDQNISEMDEMDSKKRRKKEWLEWYSKSKSDKERY